MSHAEASGSLADSLEELTQPLFRFLVWMTRDRELAEDLTQDALLRAWEKRRSLRDPGAQRVWLFRIAVNLYRDHCQRVKRMTTADHALESESQVGPSPEQAATQREVRNLVQAAMDELPERQREVMHLRAVEELSPKEIAKVLGIPAGAVRSSLAAARKRLRSSLNDVILAHRLGESSYMNKR